MKIVIDIPDDELAVLQTTFKKIPKKLSGWNEYRKKKDIAINHLLKLVKEYEEEK